MLAGIFHEGSGLGDQLFRYITVRTLAQEKGYEWGMMGEFKGKEFMNLALPELKIPTPTKENPLDVFVEKGVYENGVDVRSYDPEINFVGGYATIDGSFEDDKYWRHNLKNINEWLKVEPLEVSDEKCLIGFRGGEYATQPDLFLPIEYYGDAMRNFNEKKFEVHTDDPSLAKQYLGLPTIENSPISHSKHSNMAYNWRSMRYAKYAIIPNSAFFILPRILKHFEDPAAITIAPRYWARRNTKVWARPACYYPEFQYV